MNRTGLKKIPPFRSDEEAENFVAESDLTEYDLSGFKKVHLHIKPQTEEIKLNLPVELLISIKKKANDQGMSYIRFITQLLEQATASDNLCE